MLLDDAVSDMPMVKTRYDLKPRLHNTTCCQTGCQSALTNRFDKRLYRVYSRLSNRVCQNGCTTRVDNRLNDQCCSFNTVVKLAVKPV